LALESEEMLVALEHAVRAVTAELLHANLLTLLRVNGAKNVGSPIHFPRPWEEKKEKPPMMRMGDFAKSVGGTRG
jgi:hypothetical protein